MARRRRIDDHQVVLRTPGEVEHLFEGHVGVGAGEGPGHVAIDRVAHDPLGEGGVGREAPHEVVEQSLRIEQYGVERAARRGRQRHRVENPGAVGKLECIL